ncbi:MAG TPA: hypothetical protein VL225_04550, partial [Vicinamibacterales bacterium]|nr:hypothetical protein [Vicinamibacterales bacterium]
VNNRDVENRLKSANDALAAHLEYARPVATIRQVLVHDAAGNEHSCFVVICAQACEVVGVRDTNNGYTDPVRRGNGLSRESFQKIEGPKTHMKSDNHNFLSDLSKFVDEN